MQSVMSVPSGKSADFLKAVMYQM